MHPRWKGVLCLFKPSANNLRALYRMYCCRDGLLNVSYLRFNIATELDVSSAAICRFGTALLLAIPSVDRPLEFFTFCPESNQLKELRGPTVASRWRFSIIEVSPDIVLLCGGDFVRKCYLLDFAKRTLSETGSFHLLHQA